MRGPHTAWLGGEETRNQEQWGTMGGGRHPGASALHVFFGHGYGLDGSPKAHVLKA